MLELWLDFKCEDVWKGKMTQYGVSARSRSFAYLRIFCGHSAGQETLPCVELAK